MPIFSLKEPLEQTFLPQKRKDLGFFNFFLRMLRFSQKYCVILHSILYNSTKILPS